MNINPLKKKSSFGGVTIAIDGRVSFEYGVGVNITLADPPQGWREWVNIEDREKKLMANIESPSRLTLWLAPTARIEICREKTGENRLTSKLDEKSEIFILQVVQEGTAFFLEEKVDAKEQPHDDT